MHRGDFDRDISKVGEELSLLRMRCQLQIYTPPLAHCTSLKPEAACSGFISVPAHTGYIGPHTLIYLCCLSERLFPPRERWRLTRFTHVYEMKFILGRARDFLWQKRTPLAPVSILSTTTSLPLYTLPPFPEWESVMDVHVHNVSKNISVTAALTPSVLYFFHDYTACS